MVHAQHYRTLTVRSLSRPFDVSGSCHKKARLLREESGFSIYQRKRLFLVQQQVSLHSHGNRSTHHRVVTHAEIAHHLYVCRN